MSTGFSKRAQYSSTFSAPWTFVSKRASRLLDDQVDPDRGGQVVDGVAAVNELADDRLRQYRVDDEMKAVALPKMEDIGLGARREVVEREHLVALVEQQLGEM